MGVGFYGNSEANDGVYQLLYALDNANHTFSGIDVLVRSWQPGAAREVSLVPTDAPVRSGQLGSKGVGRPLGLPLGPARSKQAISAPQAGVGVRNQGERRMGPGGAGSNPTHL